MHLELLNLSPSETLGHVIGLARARALLLLAVHAHAGETARLTADFLCFKSSAKATAGTVSELTPQPHAWVVGVCSPERGPPEGGGRAEMSGDALVPALEAARAAGKALCAGAALTAALYLIRRVCLIMAWKSGGTSQAELVNNLRSECVRCSPLSPHPSSTQGRD